MEMCQGKNKARPKKPEIGGCDLFLLQDDWNTCEPDAHKQAVIPMSRTSQTAKDESERLEQSYSKLRVDSHDDAAAPATEPSDHVLDPPDREPIADSKAESGATKPGSTGNNPTPGSGRDALPSRNFADERWDGESCIFSHPQQAESIV